MSSPFIHVFARSFGDGEGEDEEDDDEDSSPDEEELLDEDELPWSADEWDEPLTVPHFSQPYHTGTSTSRGPTAGDTCKGKSVASEDDDYLNIEGDGGWDWGTYSAQAGPSKHCEEETMLTGSLQAEDYEAQLTLGARFESVKQFKMVLTDLAIKRKFMFKVADESKDTFAASCKVSGCKWYIRASNRLDGVSVTRREERHTCDTSLSSKDHPLASHLWIARKCHGLHKDSNSIKISNIQQYIEKHWGVTVNYKRAWRAKEELIRLIDGNPEDAYRILPHYGRELERSNAGTHVVIERSADIPDIPIELAGYDFRRVFWMFGPVARAFRRTLRPLLTLDGTFLKGKYPGVLLVATAIDGNQQLMCLAYAIVDKENIKTW